MFPFCDVMITPTEILYAWWRHQIELFSALLALCAGNSPATVEFPSQKSYELTPANPTKPTVYLF